MDLSLLRPRTLDVPTAALWLRIGLGAVFIVGGASKLLQLLDPARVDVILNLYLSPMGYINAFFQQFLFEGSLGTMLTPWLFLISLSTLELVSGIFLVVGFMVRPIALMFGLLLWSFVAALPVTVSPDVALPHPTYTAPALLVQARDIGLSGLMFVLFSLGSGRMSVDHWLLGDVGTNFGVNAPRWESLGLLIRLSIVYPLLVGAVFASSNNVQTFYTWPLLLAGTSIALMLSGTMRGGGAVVVGVMLWFMVTTIDGEQSLLMNLNGFKREIAFFAAGAVIAVYGGGRMFTLGDAYDRLQLAECMIRLRHKLSSCTPSFKRSIF